MNTISLKQFCAVLLLLIFSSNFTTAKIVLPSVFSDNMVLQQNSEVAIWGWGDAGENLKIVATWNTADTVKVKAGNDAKWTTKLKTVAAGGPYSIQFFGSSNIELKNVMLGEVWICSGQSNMEWSVNMGIQNGEEEAAKANHPNIRIFHVQKIGADYPQQTCNATWTVCSPETMRSTSAVGYFFARELQQKLNVPVGIIVSAWGGTPAEVWIEKSRIENNEELYKNRYTEKHDWWPANPGVCYNSMIAPVVPFGIAGAIWYQGESNCVNHKIYDSLMQTLIENWRNDFKKDFPFYFVQIAPYNYGENGTSEYVREQQAKTEKMVPNTGMVVVSDLVDNIKDIHPRNKLDVGKRLASFALAETYKLNVGAYKSPAFQTIQVAGNEIRLSFENVITGLKSTGNVPSQFLVAGADKKFVPAAAKIDGKTILVSSKEITNPVAVRFCFDDTSMPDVFSSEGLPLAPFRTD
ncbi:MAG TPA: sialate O-acetylesterase, partial [Draconibacterium sp.]|nr:sialate O-acetylesterase [Draconibacterium sp.]